MKRVVNKSKIFYIDSGGSERLTIILIHGFPLSHEMWRSQIEVLGTKYRVIAYDIRGHGKSEIGDGQYTIELFVDDLIELLNQLKIEKAILCGLSMGGYIALRTVEKNPERVKALILADTQSKSDSNEAKLKRAASVKAIKTYGVRTFADSFVKTVLTKDSVSKKNNAWKEITRLVQKNSSRSVCGTLIALAGRTDTTSTLSSIKVPTLILVGEQDNLTPPSASQEMHNKIPASETHVLPNSAHMSNLENPDEFNKHMLNFLNRLD